MAAISVGVDTFLDTASGTRANGDSVTLTAACTFTVRTDTRYMPTAGTALAFLGSTTIARGSKFLIDGTKVRWLAYTGGSGNVPTSGTTITQGGVSGVMLGVWTDLTAAASTAGSAMPASGFIKFRDVSGGTFSAGALTGISATASGADVTGWIEVCFLTAASVTSAPNGEGLVATGAWFDLGTTSGTAGQTFQTPANGGGANTVCHGIQIETTPGSGVYEWYPALLSGDKWTSTFMSTDVRSKFCQNVSGGLVRIGSDGTNTIGYLPPAGCKVRIPNIIIRTVNNLTPASNSTPGSITRWSCGPGAAAKLNFDKVSAEWTFSSTAAKSVTVTNSIFEHVMSISDAATVDLSNSCASAYITTAATRMAFTRCNSVKLDGLKAICKTAYILGNIAFDTSKNIVGTGTEVIVLGAASTNNTAIRFVNTDTVTFTSLKLKGGAVNATILNSNFKFTNTDYCDRTIGTVSTSQPTSLFAFNYSSNITIDGLTFGENGTVADTHIYGFLVSAGSNGSDNVRVRNIGSATTPLNCGSNASLYPNNIINFSSISRNCKVQRVYLSGTRTAATSVAANGLSSNPFAPNITMESVYVGSNAAQVLSYVLADGYIRSVHMVPSFTSPSSVTTGMHWMDFFDASTTTTTGRVMWFGSTPSDSTSSLNYITSSSSYAGYIGTGLALGVSGDTAYSEMPYFALGHTGFQNVAPTITATGIASYTVQYQIDTGSGFNGTWKTLNASNLSAETVNPAIGFKLKFLFTFIGAGNGSATVINAIMIPTTTSVAARANMYPLDTVSLSFTGLQPGSEVRCYTGTDPSTAVEIGGVESTSGSTFSFTHSSGGVAGYIMVFALGYQPLYIPYTYKSTDDSILIQQVIDRNYSNPA